MQVTYFLNYVEQWLILALLVTAYFSISTFASLVAIPVGIMQFHIGIKNCEITAGIKMYKSFIKKKKKERDKIVLFGKDS